MDLDEAPTGTINIRQQEKGDGDDEWHYKLDDLGILGADIEANHRVATNCDNPHEAPSSDRDAIPPGCLCIALRV